jgi:hypothetical protein
MRLLRLDRNTTARLFENRELIKEVYLWTFFIVAQLSWEKLSPHTLGQNLHVSQFIHRTRWLYHHELFRPEKELQQLVITVHLILPFQFFYFFNQLILPWIIMIILYRKNKEIYRGTRRVIFASLLLLPYFLIFPTANPITAQIGVIKISHLQIPSKIMYDFYATFPSLHIYYSLVITYALYQLTKKKALWVYPIFMCWVVMGTENHLFIDCLGAALLFVIAELLLNHFSLITQTLTNCSFRVKIDKHESKN